MISSKLPAYLHHYISCSAALEIVTIVTKPSTFNEIVQATLLIHYLPLQLTQNAKSVKGKSFLYADHIYVGKCSDLALYFHKVGLERENYKQRTTSLHNYTHYFFMVEILKLAVCVSLIMAVVEMFCSCGTGTFLKGSVHQNNKKKKPTSFNAARITVITVKFALLISCQLLCFAHHLVDKIRLNTSY